MGFHPPVYKPCMLCFPSNENELISLNSNFFSSFATWYQSINLSAHWFLSSLLLFSISSRSLSWILFEDLFPLQNPGKSVIEDPLSPFFLHHSDNAGLVLISNQLTGDNYASWSRTITIALSVKTRLDLLMDQFRNWWFRSKSSYLMDS